MHSVKVCIFAQKFISQSGKSCLGRIPRAEDWVTENLVGENLVCENLSCENLVAENLVYGKFSVWKI